MIVAKVEGISKLYQLGEVGTGTISHDLNRWWAKIRGKEDPYTLVGQVNDRTKNVNSEFVWALKDISFSINKGDALGIIGRNGAGKSTLLKIISQITSPTTGSIKAKGRIASLLEIGTGMHQEMTARENIYLNGAILGMKKREIDNKFDEIVEFSGCAMYVDTPVKRFSSGMRVRLGFAVAAFLEPEILLIDEVLAVGDIEFQKKCIGKMGDIANEGRTIVYVSHQMNTISALCNRAIVLNDGKLIFDGSTENAISTYLSKQEINTLEVKNKKIANGLVIENLKVSNNILVFDDFSYFLKITNANKTQFNSLFIIIYNSYGQRVTVIDLREINMPEKSIKSTSFEINGCIKEVNLLPGEYSVGLYIHTTSYGGYVDNLQSLIVNEDLSKCEIMPLKNENRGCLIFKNSFKIDYL